jgi:hypothetical protein
MLIHPNPDPTRAEAARLAILADETLSLIAVAVLLKMLAHAPEWNINAKTFHELGAEARGDRAESKRSIRMAFRELEEAGYMRRSRGRFAHGGFFTLLEVFDVPFGFEASTYGRDRGVMPVSEGGFVYVIGQANGSVVKIGTTMDLKHRLGGLQNGHPYRLAIRWSCLGNVELESHLHRAFDALRLEGEWFDFKGEDPVGEVVRAAESFYGLPAGTLTVPMTLGGSPETLAG